MKISAKTEYACIAMLELAVRYGSGEPVRIRAIADEHGIPARFLVQILLQLKGAGLVSSTRGASGGYQLNRRPDEISLADVMAVIEGQDESPSGGAADQSRGARVLRDAWREVDEAQRAMLSSLSFAELAARVKQQADMYYI